MSTLVSNQSKDDKLTTLGRDDTVVADMISKASDFETEVCICNTN